MSGDSYQRYYAKKFKTSDMWGIYDAHGKRFLRPNFFRFAKAADAVSAAKRYDENYVKQTGDGPEGLKELLRLW